MYVHAYQSYVWNFAVSERWRLYGDKVVPGDMILVNEAKGVDTIGADQVDADGEVVLLPDAGDSAPSLEDAFVRARPLTSEEAASGQYSIFDIVLPLPGFDVVYPPNELTAFYERFMASEQGGKLDPHDMRRKWKDISLSGGYRKILSRPGPDYSLEVKTYTDDNEQFVSTDRERLGDGSNAPQPETERQPASNAAESSTNASEKLAVVVKFQLGASQYATMALRELMKGGATAYKPDFGGRM
jgi:tRNA pseudouridine13 synthase